MIRHWRPVLALVLVVQTLSASQISPGEEGEETLPPRYQKWLEEVALLITPKERELFLVLGREYQREAFMEAFWRARDPFPDTARNEFREIWTARLEKARAWFEDLSEDRARMLLLNGEPRTRSDARCPGLLQSLEIWYYPRTDRIPRSFYLVFVEAPAGRRGAYRLWYPSEGIVSLLDWSVTPAISDSVVIQRIEEECFRGGDILAALAAALDWGVVERQIDVVPKPGDEWVKTFFARSTDLPDDAKTLPARLDISYPGRYQSRTLVQGLITVPVESLEEPPAPEDGFRTFVLDGEVLRRESLFENFRYRFQLQLPGPDLATEEIPLVFQRYLRPGLYTLVVRLQDLKSHRFFRQELELEVPWVESRPPARVPEVADGAVLQSPELLAEANAALPTGDHGVKLLAPSDRLKVGKERIEALTTGDGIAKVRFLLNGKPILAKTRPPYSVELDLGPKPRVHRVTAVAVDEAGKELARDEMLVNAGPHRFAIRLIEPRRGGRYRQSLRAHAEVEVPHGERLDRVEFYLNEDLMTTLYQPPFVQPIWIPPALDLAYVRAVAYLADGNSTEDVVFVNAPDYVDEIQIQLVELYTAVVDRRNRPVEGLSREDFTVLEDGVEQRILRFERVQDLPIHAGLLLDISASMAEQLKEAVLAALHFFEAVLTPKDRAMVFTFNERPSLRVRFTNRLDVLAGGLADLTAEGETAIYDSLIEVLFHFSGIKGKRTLILLTDGQDIRSRYSFEDAVDYARRTGVAIYTIGLGLPAQDVEVRMRMQRLSEETGGRFFAIQSVGGLGSVYQSIEEEVRSQYLIAYQSSRTETDEAFRRVEVQVARPGLQAKTIRGYYP